MAVSPTYGIVEDVDRSENAVWIYVAPEDDHGIFAPISGDVESISFERGAFDVEGSKFIVQPPKTGRLGFEIEDEEGRRVFFRVEVGKPKYITNTVRTDVRTGNRVRRGQRIGEILIGSRSYIRAERGSFLLSEELRRGKKLIGGVTELFVERIGRFV